MSWKALPEISIDAYTYEVGFAISSGNGECSQASVPLTHALITEENAEVNGLKSDTCYTFGIRVYSSRVTEPGEWNIVVASTLSQGM